MKKTHPLADPLQSRLALFTGGRQASIIRDSFLLMKQAAPLLPKGDNILYINTLTTAAVVEEVADKLSVRYKTEISTISISSRMMMERLEFIEHTIISKRIKLVILNCFEFAAIYSRQRSKLATWLREMRDAHDVRVVVYSHHEPQKSGGLGTLAWLADRTQEVGAWQYESDDSLSTQEDSLAAAKEFSEMLDKDPEDLSLEPYAVDRLDSLQMFNAGEIFSRNSLKNNELAGVVTLSEVRDEVKEEEFELEMA
jgi:hypothetical protein